MNFFLRLLVVSLTSLLVVRSGAMGQVYPNRVPSSEQGIAPQNSAGYVEAYFGNTPFSGSGSVALDRRLVFGCAHVVYDNGRWAGLFAFARAYDSFYRPSFNNYSIARGFRILDGYYANKSDDYFDYDFAVAYAGYSGNFGPALRLVSDSYSSLTGSASKRILGYPSYLDYFWENFWQYTRGYFYMHKTGDFTLSFELDQGSFYYPTSYPYLDIDNVTTGPGNSGGPVLVYEGGEWKLAGILVSGGANSAGIFSVDTAAKSMADLLLYRVENGQQKEVTTTKPVVLRDGSLSYRSMKLDLGRRLPWETVRVTLRMDVQASSTNEVQAFLRSPSGRSYIVSSANVNATADVLGIFASDGSDSGRWILYARDVIAGNGSAIVNRAALTLSSRLP
jgi:hypothetical protein